MKSEAVARLEKNSTRRAVAARDGERARVERAMTRESTASRDRVRATAPVCAAPGTEEATFLRRVRQPREIEQLTMATSHKFCKVTAEGTVVTKMERERAGASSTCGCIV